METNTHNFGCCPNQDQDCTNDKMFETYPYPAMAVNNFSAVAAFKNCHFGIPNGSAAKNGFIWIPNDSSIKKQHIVLNLVQNCRLGVLEFKWGMCLSGGVKNYCDIKKIIFLLRGRN